MLARSAYKSACVSEYIEPYTIRVCTFIVACSARIPIAFVGAPITGVGKDITRVGATVDNERCGSSGYTVTATDDTTDVVTADNSTCVAATLYFKIALDAAYNTARAVTVCGVAPTFVIRILRRSSRKSE